MRLAALLAIAIVACAPAAAVQPSPTEDPRVAALQAQVDALTAAARATPDILQRGATFVLWNTPVTMQTGLMTLGVPDTFSMQVRFTATNQVQTRFLTFAQFARYMNTGSLDGAAFSAGTIQDITFHDAEGCGDYVMVLLAPIGTVVTPNLSITRNPADHPTGACAK